MEALREALSPHAPAPESGVVRTVDINTSTDGYTSLCHRSIQENDRLVIVIWGSARDVFSHRRDGPGRRRVDRYSVGKSIMKYQRIDHELLGRPTMHGMIFRWLRSGIDTSVLQLLMLWEIPGWWWFRVLGRPESQRW